MMTSAVAVAGQGPIVSGDSRDRFAATGCGRVPREKFTGLAALIEH